jgi:hypothetical protein
MIDKPTLETITPKATPTDQDLRLWQRLSAGERQRRLSTALDEARLKGASTNTIDDLWTEALRRIHARKNPEHIL